MSVKFVLRKRCVYIRPLQFNRCRAQMTATFPRPPKPPSEEDCCNSGCSNCVKDLYAQELKIWQQECENIRLQHTPRSQLSAEIYMKCPLIAIKSVAPNTCIYTFDAKGYVKIKPGQHLVLREYINDSYITREYTPVEVPKAEQTSFSVVIKLYANGYMSSIIGKQWCIGYESEWRGPLGNFLHDPDKYNKYLLVAAGTGCSPMIGVVKDILANDNDITTVRLLYATRTYEEILFKPELKEFSRHWNFSCKHFISQDSEALKKKQYGESLICRRLNIDDLKLELSNPDLTRILVCGTKQFEDEMLKHLALLNINPDNVHKF